MLQNIDKELVPIKAHYFLFNAATGPIVPFLPTIAKQLGFSATLVGTTYTLLPISGLISKPLFGGLADKFKIHKAIFLAFQAILAIAFFTISFIPGVDRSANVTLICDNSIAFLEICPQKEFSKAVLEILITDSHTYSTCHLVCKGPSRGYMEVLGKNVSMNSTFEFDAGFDIYQDLLVRSLLLRFFKPAHYRSAVTGSIDMYWALEVSSSATSAAIISWIGMAVVVSIADTICFDLLGYERRKDYGKQKMWGSIGFGIFGISAGYLVDVFSDGRYDKDYTCIFYIMLIAMFLDIVVSATLKKRNPECIGNEPSLLWELFSIAREGRVLVFGWWCIGAGMCTGVVWNFVFWYTEDLATSSQFVWLKTLQGLLTGVQSFLGELPFNFISGAVLKKFGHTNVMSLVLLIYAIRFMAYSIAWSPWIFLIFELFHGPSFGLCWPTMVSYSDKVTPNGTKAIMQGFIGAVFEGIGVSLGSLICGWLIDTYGGSTAFRIFSVGAIVWLSIFWMMELILRKFKAYPLRQGHSHLANYANPDDAILMTISQELQTY